MPKIENKLVGYEVRVRCGAETSKQVEAFLVKDHRDAQEQADSLVAKLREEVPGVDATVGELRGVLFQLGDKTWVARV